MEKELSTPQVMHLVKNILGKYRPQVKGKKERIHLDVLINNQLVLLHDLLSRMEQAEKN